MAADSFRLRGSEREESSFPDTQTCPIRSLHNSLETADGFLFATKESKENEESRVSTRARAREAFRALILGVPRSKGL